MWGVSNLDSCKLLVPLRIQCIQYFEREERADEKEVEMCSFGSVSSEKV